MYRDYNQSKNDKNVLKNIQLDISESSRQLLNKIFEENEAIEEIIRSSPSYEKAKKGLRKLALDHIKPKPVAFSYFSNGNRDQNRIEKLDWSDLAAIRILDYIDHENDEYEDLNLHGKYIVNAPFKLLYMAAHEGKGGATEDFFRDMLHLFRQFSGKQKRFIPNPEKVAEWMNNHPSGLDPEIIDQRKKNRDRIIRLFIKKIDSGDIQRNRFKFEPGMTYWQKYRKIMEWWNDKTFHLQFAARTPERLNRMLGRSIDENTMETMVKAENSGIPFFVNPYYLSLLNVDIDEKNKFSDQAIRDYVFVSNELVEEFGQIQAWEKEDQVEPGKPNAAGWILPNRKNIHRRYPEVAILIPDTAGRACGGLCVVCQRMYDFQNGHLNFDLDELKPRETWWERLPKLMRYFEYDNMLRDILITGGDAFMNSDNSLKRILDEVLNMANRKKSRNKNLPDGEKLAEIQRVRLGTRLPVYLPQRISDELISILKDFRTNAIEIGINQFVVQTHFESAMEVTPEAAEGVRKILSAGWIVTNQLVFTPAASRRGHTAKLRKVLNDIGVLAYYTFSVKGYKENTFNFVNNARIMQEQVEEKYIGKLSDEINGLIKGFHTMANGMLENIESIRQISKVPFLATDKNVINLPGVGKSLSFRTIGITYDGRRILQFDYDFSRNHSPVIKKNGKVVIIESKSIAGYIRRLEEMGENRSDYENVWGYSIGETEERNPIYKYPEYNYAMTDRFSNFEMVYQ
ncbi:MAG: KamA family protein [Bacteroidales bacterium]